MDEKAIDPPPPGVAIVTGEAGAKQLMAMRQNEALLSLAAYPRPTGRRPAGLQLLAVAGAHGTLVCDCARTPELASIWQRVEPHAADGRGAAMAALDAQSLQHALWRAGGGTVDRWACAHLNEQLLAGAGEGSGETTLSALAAAHNTVPPPAGADSLQALIEEAAAIRAVVAAQGARLVALGMQRASRLEGACVVPTALLERNGMPFDRAALTAQLTAESRALADGSSALSAEARASLEHLHRQVGHDFLRFVEADGRIRPRFVQIGATTGRMACREPNLQGVPKAGRRRHCFVAPAGRVLVSGDYAACELRILAQKSNDPSYKRAFLAGKDVHAEVATALFGQASSTDARREQREVAKMLSFGLIYGMQAQGLARRLGQSLATANALLARFFAAYPELQGYLEVDSNKSVQAGFATTLLGRRLALVADDRGRAERLARNMPIQGSGAELAKGALVRTVAAMANNRDILLVHAVHDSILLECSADAAQATADLLERAMLTAASDLLPDVPMVVDIRSGASWGDA